MAQAKGKQVKGTTLSDEKKPKIKEVQKEKNIKTADEPIEKNTQDLRSEPKDIMAAHTVESRKPGNENKSDRGSILLGAGLLFMGVVLLAGRLLKIPFGDFLWPFIFIVPGALLFLSALSSERSNGEGLSILGGIISMLGLVFLMQAVTGLWASWAYIWALVAPTSIGLSQIVYGNLKGRDAIAASGWRLVKIGATILVFGFIFFELIIGISGFGLDRYNIPVFPMILIFFGVIMLVRSFINNR